ncbi:MAG: biotin/lipoyl-binding protein, partial [Betaproteobacteria bacterium]|nr:biotin/lipoyl-binding protein [Betaproteobacteria bacterium]
MSMDQASGRTYSDAWHRVAGVRACLRSSVRAHRQTFRGQDWVVLRDSLSSDFFRVTADAYAFVSRLGTDRIIDEVWSELIEAEPDVALTQEEVVQLLGQLHLSNLLQFDRGAAAASLFERYRERRGREIKALLLGFLTIKVPLIDPDRALDRSMPLIRLLFGPVGALCYLVLLVLGTKALVDESHRLFDQSAGLLAPGNLGLLYAGLVLAKLVHEFGHAAACKRYGGEVHKMGVMLLLFAPLPYMDATASWGFRSRFHRMLVGASGVLAEFAVAAVAALVWANSAPGVINALAYNVIFVASVSTLLFNLNPLMRFDGYHMLVDWLDVPNLFQRSRDQLKYLGERFALGVKNAEPAARTRKEAWLLPTYGVISLGYWLVLMSTIIFFIAEQYLEVGIALAWIVFFTAIALPLLKFAKYLVSSPRLQHQRLSAVTSTAVIGSLAFAVLAGVPMPERVRVKGVLQASDFRELYSESGGTLVQVLVRPGSWVKAGQPLARLDNPELGYEILAARRQREQLLAQELQAVSMAVANLQPLVRQRQAIEEKIAQLLLQQKQLVVLAPIEGIWSASELEASRGQWIGRGASMGTVVDDRSWRFVAVLPQVSTHLFEAGVVYSEIRIGGQQEFNVRSASTEIMPFEQGQLPSAALGMAGGGDIAVQSGDSKGLAAAEPFFR